METNPHTVLQVLYQTLLAAQKSPCKRSCCRWRLSHAPPQNVNISRSPPEVLLPSFSVSSTRWIGKAARRMGHFHTAALLVIGLLRFCYRVNSWTGTATLPVRWEINGWPLHPRAARLWSHLKGQWNIDTREWGVASCQSSRPRVASSINCGWWDFQ